MTSPPDPASRRRKAPPSPSTATTLSLGSLFHDLRGGVGDAGTARVSIRFEQRASQGSVDGDNAIPAQLTKTSLLAELDFRDSELRRADMLASNSQTTSHLRVSFLAHENAFLYSHDGVIFGRFVGPVVIFDIGSFEELLSFITVRDVTIDERPDTRGSTLDVLDIDLDHDAFRRLLRIFGADTEEAPEEFDLDSYSVNLTSGGDLVVDYWWQLSGEEVAGKSRIPTTVNCHVTIRLVAMTPLPDPDVLIDATLPLLDRVDDVWDIARLRANEMSDPGE